jgi:survival of motor neuron-related-splicing factor 30
MDDVEAKLSAYEDQLRQVTSILESDSHNEQFIQLRNDLQKLIGLTRQLTEVSTPALPQHAVEQPAGNAEDSDDDDLEYAFNNTAAGAKVAGHSDVLRVVSTGALKVGDNVAVTSAESVRPFAAVITSLLPDKENCTVKYFEYFDSADVTLPLTSVVHLSSVANNSEIPCSVQIEPGLRCRCKYSADQIIYEAVVDKVVTGQQLSSTHRGSSYAVTFAGYGNSEIVPIEYIQLLPSEAPVATHAAATANKTADGLDSLIAIPENLKIKPTDSEEEKLRKKKKIKAIKSRNRLISKGNEQTETKNSWQKFVKKVCAMLRGVLWCAVLLV